MPRGFHLLIAAQFVSALADNALIIVAIAWLASHGQPPWWAPLLKVSFTLAYVLLAPGVGALADAMPKARLMMAMNALKVLGVLALPAGIGPFAAMAVVGFGAAAYAPAKYGLVTELVPPHRLVAANGWIEATTVAAVLLGTGVGGLLVSPIFGAAAAAWAPGLDVADAALVVLMAVYALAALMNLGIPDSGARYPRSPRAVRPLVADFVRANRALWRDPEGGLSLAMTTIFWGAAATLQFAVLRWAGEHLGLGLDRAAYLQALVAIGVIAGAIVAARLIPLHHARRVLPLGVVLGLMVPPLAQVQSLDIAMPLLMLVGACGGAMVVPMNALLQHRGHVLLTAGRSIAVQNFNENLSALLMLAGYAALTALEVPAQMLLSVLGACVALGIAAVVWRHRRQGPSRRSRAIPLDAARERR
jgi:MFS transporter, LPLT family, lysophospholipid transporter